MEFHQWQQQLRDALRSQRVSRRYSERLLEELEVHFLDLQEASQMDIETGHHEWVAQLGDPEEIARQATSVPHPTWTGRHPWLGIIVGAPAFALAFTLILGVVVVFAFLPFASGKTIQTDPWMGPVMATLGPLQVMVPALIASLLICRNTDRSERSPWWGICGCGLIALFCAATAVTWSPASITPGTGNLAIGMSFPFGATSYQAIVPLLVAIVYWFVRLSPRRPPQDGQMISPMRAAA